MGTTLRNSYEGGTNGANITVANSGGASGTAFAALVYNNVSVSGSGNAGMVYWDAWTINGAMGARVTCASSVSYQRMDFTETATRYVARRGFEIQQTPTANFTLLSMYAVTTLMGSVVVDTNMKVRPYRASTGLTVSTNAISLNTKYIIEYAITKESGGGGNGVIEYQVYLASTGLPVTGVSGSFTSQATTTADVTGVRFGGASATPGVTYDYLDDLAINALDGTGNWIGPASNDPPEVSGVVSGSNPTSPSTLVTITYTATDADGVASRTTQFTYPESGAPSITDGTTSTPDFTTSAATSALYRQTQTATDVLGAEGTSDAVEVYVAGTGTIVPLSGTTSQVATGGSAWTLVGGGANEGATLADASGTTLVESPDITATEVERRYRLGPSVPRTNPRFTLLGALLTEAGSNINKVRVYVGDTLITTRLTSTLKKVSDNSTSDVTTSSQDLYFDLTAPETAAVGAITNGFCNLWIAFVVDAS